HDGQGRAVDGVVRPAGRAAQAPRRRRRIGAIQVGGSNMASIRKRGAVWYYRYSDENGVKTERRGCPDKRSTEEMARAAEANAARRRAGLIDPKAESYRDHDARPLAGHLDDFQAALIAKGNTPKHARLYAERARRVAALARGANLAEIEAP